MMRLNAEPLPKAREELRGNNYKCRLCGVRSENHECTHPSRRKYSEEQPLHMLTNPFGLALDIPFFSSSSSTPSSGSAPRPPSYGPRSSDRKSTRLNSSH